MILSTVSFFIFLSSIMVITSYSPVTSVVYLIATFVITAIYLSSQNIVYIALTYIIVYVGAVITLFLFVVMIMNLQTELSTTPFTQTIPLTMVIVILYTIIIVNANTSIEIGFQTINQLFFYQNSNWTSESIGLTTSVFNHWNQIQSIGFELYTHQAMWLVLVSMVLMISMIGPIVICRTDALQRGQRV